MDKTKFLADLAATSRAIVELAKAMQALDCQYTKMNYGPGNANQITDAQASAIGATAGDVGLAITAVEALLTPLLQSGYIVNFFKLS
jgi:hypothetical protein